VCECYCSKINDCPFELFDENTCSCCDKVCTPNTATPDLNTDSKPCECVCIQDRHDSEKTSAKPDWSEADCTYICDQAKHDSERTDATPDWNEASCTYICEEKSCDPYSSKPDWKDPNKCDCTCLGADAHIREKNDYTPDWDEASCSYVC